MAVSGIMLWANNLMLALLPKSWLDVATSIHFYEAALAALAIVVWHFYAVIFDPDVYPMDTAWFSGIPCASANRTRTATSQNSNSAWRIVFH